MCNLKKNTNALTHKTHSHTQKTSFYLSKVQGKKAKLGVWD